MVNLGEGDGYILYKFDTMPYIEWWILKRQGGLAIQMLNDELWALQSCVFKFLGTGIQTCDGGKVGSIVKWLPSPESAAVTNSVLDGVCGLFVWLGNHSETSVLPDENSFLFFHMDAFWCSVMSLRFALLSHIQLYLWSWPLIMLLTASLYVCLFYIFTWKYFKWTIE